MRESVIQIAPPLASYPRRKELHRSGRPPGQGTAVDSGERPADGLLRRRTWGARPLAPAGAGLSAASPAMPSRQLLLSLSVDASGPPSNRTLRVAKHSIIPFRPNAWGN